MPHLRAAIQFLEQLIQFNSVSSHSNIEITKHVEKILDVLGFKTEWTEYRDSNGIRKANVIGRRGNGNNGLAYFCHTDVVPAEEWFSNEHTPFQPQKTEDKIYGRGSCDMKGSLAAVLAAVEQFGNQPFQKPFYIACTADEEVGYRGARHLVKNSKMYREIVAQKTSCIIGEPTMLEVMHAHKGVFMFQVESKGEAAHSSTQEGKNANLAMIPFLVEMKNIHDETENNPQWHRQSI